MFAGVSAKQRKDTVKWLRRAGFASVIAGLLIVVGGVWSRDVALISLGAGMLGAPGAVTALNAVNSQEGTTDETG